VQIPTPKSVARAPIEWMPSLRGGMVPARRGCMNERAEELKKRTKRFAIDVLTFGRTLPHSDEARDIGRQLRRAATGMASNYRACCRGRSRAEFVAKLGIALEEADESAFWLEVIVEAGILGTPDYSTKPTS
jgi:four helix bundle protein